MAKLSYRDCKLLLRLGVSAAAAVGCPANDPGTAEQPSSDMIEFQFRTVGTGYRGKSVMRPDGTIESRPATSENEAN